MRRLTVLLALCVPSLVGAEPSLMDNLDARVIMAQYDKSVTDAKRAYDLAVAKAATTAIKELQHVQADETKMGRLEVAMAAKKKIEELQPLTAVAAAAPKIAPEKERFLASLVGEWTTFTNAGPYVFTRTDDGGIAMTEPSKGNSSRGYCLLGNNAVVLDWGGSAMLVEFVNGKTVMSNYHEYPTKPIRPSGGSYFTNNIMHKKP